LDPAVAACPGRRPHRRRPPRRGGKGVPRGPPAGAGQRVGALWSVSRARSEEPEGRVEARPRPVRVGLAEGGRADQVRLLLPTGGLARRGVVPENPLVATATPRPAASRFPDCADDLRCAPPGASMRRFLLLFLSAACTTAVHPPKSAPLC